MTNKVWFIILMFILYSFINGCAYNVKPATAAAVNIYSTYEDRIPGNFVIVLDPSVRQLNKEIKPSSWMCSAHTYPVNINETLAISIMRTMESIFENITEKKDLPIYSGFKGSGYTGAVLISVKEFNPTLSFIPGFWSASCTAETDIQLEVQVIGPSGKLLHTTAGDTGTAQGDAGGTCEGGATVLAKSIEKATRDVLERVAERLHGSEKIRKTVSSS